MFAVIAKMEYSLGFLTGCARLSVVTLTRWSQLRSRTSGHIGDPENQEHSSRGSGTCRVRLRRPWRGVRTRFVFLEEIDSRGVRSLDETRALIVSPPRLPHAEANAAPRSSLGPGAPGPPRCLPAL